jgi:hypothetical protein
VNRTRLLAIALLAAPALASADAPPCSPGASIPLYGLGSPADDLLRTAELAGAAVPTSQALRRGGAREAVLCEGAELPWPLAAPPPVTLGELALRIVPPRLDAAVHTRYPGGANDGLLWAGRGASGMLSGGVALRWRFLSAAIAPELAASANEPFDTVPLPGAGALANPYYGDNIDLPQRFGTSPRTTWSPGQSYLRADAFGVGLGISNENLWFGPGIRNALVMSNAGPGFPHVFAGTSHPADVRIGWVEGLLFWGRLERSEDFVHQSEPLVSGVVVAFAPAFAPTLTLGFTRVFVQTWDRSLSTLLAPFQRVTKSGLEDNPDDNQIATLYARWVLPESGFEVYGEWGREDHEIDMENVVREPDHAQAYLLGLQKVWSAGRRTVRLQAELTHLQELRPVDNARGVPVWYTHGANLSWTHRGQLLGAWIGPGGDAQTLAVDVFGPGGRVGGFVERVRRNDAYYWAVIEPVVRETAPGDPRHDTELAAGARGVVLRRGWELSWEAAAAYRWHREFRWSEPDFRVATTLSFPFGAGATRRADAAAP